ncbi:MAG TPA: GGDEF domain-containing protein [Candidatus Limnocylindrales bacterium]|nr:GGDEF domain-containing protein [Candidatus Limnocylindrales bacterium]
MGRRGKTPLPEDEIEPTTGLIATALAALLAGALAGALLFESTVGARRRRRVVDVLLRLADGDVLPEASGRIHDPALREAFRQLGLRLLDAHRVATTDRLTGVLNRETLLRQLDLEVERAQRYDRPLSIAFVDVDHTRRINDGQGQVAGDVVLCEVARRLHDGTRAVDLVGRIGGDEFVIMLPETDAERAGLAAESLRRALAALPIELPGGMTTTAGLSIGVAGGRGTSLRAETLLRDAEAAAGAAKGLGRGQVYVFSAPPQVSAPMARDAAARRSPRPSTPRSAEETAPVRQADTA